jgi:hypothetical protein
MMGDIDSVTPFIVFVILVFYLIGLALWGFGLLLVHWSIVFTWPIAIYLLLAMIIGLEKLNE